MDRIPKPAMLGMLIGLAALAAAPQQPLFVYNDSPSAPRGFYVRSFERPHVGAFVTVPAVRVAPAYAMQRHFTAPADRFIKRIAAAGGATVCAHGALVHVGSLLVLTRARIDSMGRTLPSWCGCIVLGPDQFFLVGETADSFDSRYWGPANAADIDGVWRPIRPRFEAASAAR